MSIVTSVSTVSYRYYVKRPKSTIIQRIEEMRSQLKLPKFTHEELCELRAKTADQLAHLALDHHRQLPDDDE